MGITNEEQQIKAEIEAQLFLKNHNIDYYERATVDAVVLIMEQYEARLKEDLVAMLTDIQLEIEEIEMSNNVPFGFEPVNKFYEGISASSKLIQQKIDKLKENNEPKERKND